MKEKSLAKVAKKLNSLGYRTKVHKTKTGKIIGGNEFIITSLRHILTNPIYIGYAKHKGKIYKAQHPVIIEKEVFDKAQKILGENKKTFTSLSQNKYNLLLRGLVKCGYCGSVMSSHYSIKNGQKYFYYKCTRVMHRDKKACPSKPLSARKFENAIVEKIKELSQDRSQLEETLKNANLVAQKELEPLIEKKILLEKGKKRKGRRDKKAYQGYKGRKS